MTIIILKKIFFLQIIGQKLMENFPDKMILIGADKVYTEKNIMDTEIYEVGRSFRTNMAYPSIIPCFLFPNHDKFEVRYCWFTRFQLQSEKTELVWNKIKNELTPESKSRCKTIFMLFTFNCGKKFFKNFGRYLRER